MAVSRSAEDLASQVQRAQFVTTRLRPGYVEDDVDEFSTMSKHCSARPRSR